MKISFFTVVFMTVVCVSAQAVPVGNMTNIFERIAWNEMFPLKVGGVTVKSASENYDIEDVTDDAVCTCDLGAIEQVGTTVSYWEPARMVETVKDGFYSPFLGIEIDVGDEEKAGFLDGANVSAVDGDGDETFMQAHFYEFPVMKLLELMMGMTCGEMNPFDIAYMSELDPNWNDDILSMESMPDALLFSNPYAVMACIADAVAATFEFPIDPMIWCLGYDTTYPLTGKVGNVNVPSASFTIAGRAMFLQARYLNMPDTAMNECMNLPWPVLWKSHYKLQLAKPVKGNRAIPLGMMQMMWSSGSNPIWNAALNFTTGSSGEAADGSASADDPGYAEPATDTGGTAVATGNDVGSDGESSDNFLWIMFRKQVCCYM